ncbi:MAG: hypothetical protein CMN32_00270 [Saprospirales bacterium]|nr:hypothetical protein [Saprospirales bacterium]
MDVLNKLARKTAFIAVFFAGLLSTVQAKDPAMTAGHFTTEACHKLSRAFEHALSAKAAALALPPPCILLDNTGFESGFSDWYKYGSVSITGDAWSGSSAAELKGFYSYVSQTKTGILPGSVYTIKAHAKRTSNTWSAILALRFYDSGGSLISENTVNVTSTSSYSEYQVSAMAPAGSYHIQVYALKFGGTSLKVDEFCLSEETPPMGECILIHNEGFENNMDNWLIAGGTVTNTSDAFTGNSAVKVVSNGATFFQRLAVLEGQTYELTAWAKVGGVPNYAELYVEWKDVNNQTLSSILQPILEYDVVYRQFSLKGKAPAGAVIAEVGGYKSGSSSTYLFADDFCFKQIDPLGGNDYPLGCGCSDNMVPNGGFEESNVSSFPVTLEGSPAKAMSNGDASSIEPWFVAISSKYMFYVNDQADVVNNPEGDYFVWIPGDGDCYVADVDFSNNLVLEDGQTYRFCFYAAAWTASLANNGLPDGGTEPQHPAVLNMEFDFVSGFKPVFAWAIPSSDSWNNLSWTLCEYTFTYNIQDPISSFIFTNSRPGVGVAIDAVSLTKVNCPNTIDAGIGGLAYERWGNIPGTEIKDLVSNRNYPNNYNETGYIYNFQGPNNYDNNYGTRVYGYIVPPETGTYTFNVTGDDNCRLYLSTDSSFLNKSKICEVPGYTSVTQHTKYSEQTSGPVSLVAGNKYYVELLHKEGGGGDHFQVYWKTPSNSSWNIIPGSAMAPIAYQEVCYNDRDDDFDGLTDCEDDDCGPILVGNYTVTDENCGSGGGAIDVSPQATDVPLSFRWSDMPETAWWTFEQSTDDVSGNVNHNNGVNGYPIYSRDCVQGRYSIYFNGSTYVRYSVDNGFMEKNFTKATVALWFKPNKLNGIQTLFDEGGSSGGKGWAIRLSNNVLHAGVKSSSQLYSDATHIVPNDGQWHHVAMVFDEGDFTVYLDGVPSPTISTGLTEVKNHGNNGGLGNSISGSVLNGGNTYYNGLMDDVRYYMDVALSPDQIADLASLTGDRTNLLAGSYAVTLSSASGCTTTAVMNVASSSNYTDGGTISGDESQCVASYDPAPITEVSGPSGGGAGTAEFQWQSSTDGGSTWTTISGAQSATYDPPVISQTTWYRRGARLVPCLDWIWSNAVTKTFVSNFTNAGAISGAETSCDSYDPAPIVNVILPSGGDAGTAEYQWQKSTDGGATWTDIPGAVTDSYDPGSISVTTWYRRGARRSACANYLYTEPVIKTVVNNYTDAGSISGTETKCGSFDPELIGSTAAPSGGQGGSLEYQWQKSTDGGSTWTDVPGANAETFNPPPIIQTTQFRRGARRNPCSAFIYTTPVTKMVVNNFTNGGYITGDEVQCGSYDPGLIDNLALPSGGVDGTIVYRWQKSTNLGANWYTIAGANAATYDPPVITQTTWYRRQAQRSPCSAWINSNTVVKTVKPLPTAMIATYPATDNGYLCELIQYTFEAAPSANGTAYSWDFGQFATPQSATGAGPHAVSFNVPNTVASTTVTVILTTDLNGCPTADTMQWQVRPQIIVTNLTSTDPSTCNVSDGTINITTNYPPGTSIEGSIDGGTTWSAPPFSYSGLAGGVYDIRLRYSGQECELEWGSVTLTEPSSLVAAIQVSPTEVCTGSAVTVSGTVSGGSGPYTFTWNFGSGATPQTATGAGPHSVSFANGGSRTIHLTVQDSFCFGYADTTLSIVGNFTQGGAISGEEDLCSNIPASTITSLSQPFGGTGGAAEYQWEKRESDGMGGWTAWQDIAGATADTLSPGTISVTTEFRRKARRSPCSAWVLSNSVQKRTSEAPQPTDDLYTTACPGLFFYDNVSDNDNSVVNPVYSIATPPLNGTIDMDADGEFIYTPNSAFCGTDQFTYQVCNNGTSCCATATVTIDLGDTEVPVLQNIPPDEMVFCDDEIPLPPIVDAWENCQQVTLAMSEQSNQGQDSCAIYSYLLTRVWTAQDYCGNSVSNQQTVTIQDATAPDIYRIYTLPNGKRLVAGVMENVTHRWKTVRLPVQFATKPIVFAQVVTNNEASAVVTRLRNISTEQFQLRIQEQESGDGKHAPESVAWMAIEEGVNSTGLPFEVSKKLVSSNPVALSLAQSYTTPGFVTCLQTFNENNPVAVRYSGLTGSSATIYCQEETSLDPETNHGYESAGYLALEAGQALTLADGEAFGETGQISVSDAALTVNLEYDYHNPVVILGGISNNDGAPATIRVTSVTANSFTVKIDEWDYLDGTHGTESLSYLVIEGSLPFDREVECSAIPDPPVLGVDIVGMDNCDVSTAITVTDSPYSFDCGADTLFTRTYYIADECGNSTTLVQRFFLRDTTPPTFTVPADLTITCATNRDDLNITGDVFDEADNCADGLEASYTDNLAYLDGCDGYVLRIWSLSDYCNNTTVKYQKITVYNENDADGDGLADLFDLDEDNDGIPDDVEGTGDTDGDGIPDRQDLDSDNDGIPDIIEAGFQDKNGDGIVDLFGQSDWDLDGDGIANDLDGDETNPDPVASSNFDPLSPIADRDGDGVPNYIDTDSDNDGIPDLIEAGGVDKDGDGQIDYPIENVASSLPDADGDGFYDLYDPDDDSSFGIDQPGEVLIKITGGVYTDGPNTGAPDKDGDGIPNFLDTDSDNDGIPDLIEAGGIDTDGDGKLDSLFAQDTTGNGFSDFYENNPLVITDGDGAVEDGRPEDTDGDGSAYQGGDLDGDGVPDYLDGDGDGDGIPDIIEIGLADLDLDGDQKIDVFIDTNGDGMVDDLVGYIVTEGDGATQDGKPEDGPDPDTSPFIIGAADGEFGETNNQPDLDDDGDTKPNNKDLDSDGDGIPDALEDKNGNGIMDEGETHWLRTDSDGDGIPDGVEDANHNGIFELGIETDPTDPDTDNDGIPDGVEDANHNGIVDGPAGSESNPRDPCDPLAGTTCIGVYLQIKVKLHGCLLESANQTKMRDDLRKKGLIPLTEPFTENPSFQHVIGCGGETIDPSVLMVSGDNAIVDWVFIELRSPDDAHEVVSTRSALVQRDGDVVDTDGSSPVFFPNVPSGDYFVAVRHRNHLGMASNHPIHLTPTVAVTDFEDDNFEAYGTNPAINYGGQRALWSGDLNADRKVIYQGPSNDIASMFFFILSSPDNTLQLMNYIATDYTTTDFNLDGVIIYQGPNNDRSKLLFYTILASPDNINLLANFVINEKLP